MTVGEAPHHLLNLPLEVCVADVLSVAQAAREFAKVFGAGFAHDLVVEGRGPTGAPFVFVTVQALLGAGGRRFEVEASGASRLVPHDLAAARPPGASAAGGALWRRPGHRWGHVPELRVDGGHEVACATFDVAAWATGRPRSSRAPTSRLPHAASRANTQRDA